MTITLNRRQLIVASGAALLLPAVATSAATRHVVEMLNQDPNDSKLRNVFSPRVLAVEPGDTVAFLATDRGHDSVSIDDMLPAGAAPWKGAINNDIEVTFERPGFYGYVCSPHASIGMVGLVVVKGDGMMDNYESAKAVKHRGKSRKVFKDIWEEVEALNLN